MGQNDWENYDEQKGYVVIDESRSLSIMNKVYIWMTLGLGLTGLTSYLALVQGWIYSLIDYMLPLIIVEIALVWILSSRITKMSINTGTILFIAYSVLNGLTLSPIFLVYTNESIASTFFISAGIFAAMAVIGTVTKRDLSGLGSLLIIGLVGVIIASLVNMFLGSSQLGFIISIVGVAIFVGLTAYDAQKIKLMAQSLDPNDEQSQKIALLGSLTLYLDFINLFLFLLRLLGNRR